MVSIAKVYCGRTNSLVWGCILRPCIFLLIPPACLPKPKREFKLLAINQSFLKTNNSDACVQLAKYLRKA